MLSTSLPSCKLQQAGETSWGFDWSFKILVYSFKRCFAHWSRPPAETDPHSNTLTSTTTCCFRLYWFHAFTSWCFARRPDSYALSVAWRSLKEYLGTSVHKTHIRSERFAQLRQFCDIAYRERQWVRFSRCDASRFPTILYG